MKNKKPLWIALISLDVVLTIILFVFSVIVLANVGKTESERMSMDPGLVRWLVYELKPWQYGVFFVVPLFILLAANIIGLVIYVRRAAKKEPVKVDDLTEEQKEALRQELLKDLSGGNKEEDKQE